MTLAMRMAATAIAMGVAAPGAAARQGAIAEQSRGVVTITAWVAGQARLDGSAGAPCLWSNTATGLIDIVATDADGTVRRPTPDATVIAARTPDCAAADALRTRRIVAAAVAAAPGDAVAILVSPE